MPYPLDTMVPHILPRNASTPPTTTASGMNQDAWTDAFSCLPVCGMLLTQIYACSSTDYSQVFGSQNFFQEESSRDDSRPTTQHISSLFDEFVPSESREKCPCLATNVGNFHLCQRPRASSVRSSPSQEIVLAIDRN